MSRPDLTDRSALLRNRDRAARRPGGPARFIHDAAIVEVQERLAEVNRSFTSPAVVTGWPGIWGPPFPGARLARLKPPGGQLQQGLVRPGAVLAHEQHLAHVMRASLA